MRLPAANTNTAAGTEGTATATATARRPRTGRGEQRQEEKEEDPRGCVGAAMCPDLGTPASPASHQPCANPAPQKAPRPGLCP